MPLLSSSLLDLVGLSKKPLATLPEGTQQAKLFMQLAQMSDKREKPFSQMLAKMVVDDLDIDQAAALAAVILEMRFSKVVDQNAAMVFRNPEQFSHQMAFAVLHKVAYPFDHNDEVLESVGTAAGIPLTPRTRERSDSSSSSSSSSLSASSSSSSFTDSVLSASSSDDIADRLAKINIPPAVVTLLLPFYRAYVGKAEGAKKNEVQQQFAGHFSFSYFSTPMQSKITEACAEGEVAEQKAKRDRFTELLKSLANEKGKLWEVLLNSLEAASANCKPTPLLPETLTRVSKIYEDAQKFYEIQMARPIRQASLLAEMFAHLGQNSSYSAECKTYFKARAKTMQDALAAFNHQLKLQVMAQTPLDISQVKAILTKLALEINLTAITYLNIYTEGQTLLHRLAAQKPTSNREKEELVKQVQLLVELRVNVKATTDSYEGNNAGSVRNFISNIAKRKMSAAAQPLTARELAERAGNSDIVAVLVAAEAGKTFSTDNKEGAAQEADELNAPPRAPSMQIRKSSTWLPSTTPSTSRSKDFLAASSAPSLAQDSDDEDSSASCDSAGSDVEYDKGSTTSISSEARAAGLLRSYDKSKVDMTPRAHSSHSSDARAALREMAKSVKPR